MAKSDRPARRKPVQPVPGRRRAQRAPGAAGKLAAREAPSSRGLIERILDTPHAALVVRQLRPEVLHRVIQTCGLEDSAELVALATPIQLQRVFDLDLWRPDRPGMDEQLDADRFATWIEVLMEAGAAAAAEKLAGMDADLVITALAQHILVFDSAAVAPPPPEDDDAAPIVRAPDQLTREVGGYLLEAKRSGAWEPIVDLLLALGEGHPEYFQRVMRGCRTLSNSGFELDGLDDLLSNTEQDMFDLAIAREQRREQQGYLTPAQARAFLQSARQVDRRQATAPPQSPIARAYFRAAATSAPEEPDAEWSGQPPTAPALPAGPEERPVSTVDEQSAAMATVLDVLFEAGVLTQQPRALLAGASSDTAAPLARLHSEMELARQTDAAAWSRRTEELAFLANALVSGCSIQSRPITPKEASDAAAAICNLGLENWPASWRPGQTTGQSSSTHEAGGSPSDTFLVTHDLIGVFQVGWTVLYEDVCMDVADRLGRILAEVQTGHPDVRAGLASLRFALAQARRDGLPWRAAPALDVIIMLDKPAWAALIALFDECPVMHAALDALRLSSTRPIDNSAFAFISENRHIAAIREFLHILPRLLRD
jgi:hypothetical protein